MLRHFCFPLIYSQFRKDPDMSSEIENALQTLPKKQTKKSRDKRERGIEFMNKKDTEAKSENSSQHRRFNTVKRKSIK